MSDDVWAARDTTPGAVETALRELLAARHRRSSSFAPARVLNVVVIVDAQFRGEVDNRLERVKQYHPSRLVVCAVTPGRSALDAVATLSSEVDEPGPGRVVVVRERVELELGERHLRRLDTVVDPLLVPALPTMVWAPHGHAVGADALRRLAQVVLIDSQDEPDVRVGLARALDLTADAEVVDLAWLRSTPWRERVAAAFDPPSLRGALATVAAIEVRHREGSDAAGLLFCGWLAARLGWQAEPLEARGEERRGSALAADGRVELCLRGIQMESPGLCGVSVTTAGGDTVALDRAPGGLRVHRAGNGQEHSSSALGASRGEAGILGEGVRQALLRDRVYRAALAAARTMAG